MESGECARLVAGLAPKHVYPYAHVFYRKSGTVWERVTFVYTLHVRVKWVRRVNPNLTQFSAGQEKLTRDLPVFYVGWVWWVGQVMFCQL